MEEEFQINVENFDFPSDGYEQLHDEEMDQISVSVHSDCDGIFSKHSQINLVGDTKMKISLSQEQLKLYSSGDGGGSSNKNFLTVPMNTKKTRSLSFSSPSEDILRISQQLKEKKILQPMSSAMHGSVNEIIYAVPQKPKKITSAIHIDDEIIQPSSVATTTSPEVKFKYPLMFYCKLCNDILKDPRTLNCLHTFCCQCLSQMDVTNNLQNNQFWRKISDSSSVQEPSSTDGSDLGFCVPEKKFFLTPSTSKSPRKLSIRNPLKEKSPTRSVKGRQSSIISFTDKPKSIICSTCGLTTEMTIHGVYRLPQNTLIARKIKEALQKDSREQLNICQLCTFSIDATSICITCSFKMCSSCKETHKRHTSHHEIKKLVGEKKGRKSNEKSPERGDGTVKCLIHLSNDLKLFCTTCCQMICSECTILIHRGHKMTSVTKASKIYLEMLRETKDNIKPLATYAMHSIAKLNDVSKKLNQKCDVVEHEVETFLMEYFQALKVHERTLLNQISRCRETKMDMIQSQQLDLERRSNEAKAAMTFTEMLLKEGTQVECLMFVSMLLKRFDACRSSERSIDVKINDTLQFLPEVKAPSNQAQHNIPLFGIITTQIAVARNCTLESLEGLMNLRVHKKTELILQTRDDQERDMCHGCANVEVSVFYRDVTFKTLPTHVSDKRDGTYIISFIPDTAGLIQISIMVNEKPIRNSPFTVRARNLKPHSGIFHCCSFCSSNGKKVCACNGVMEIDGVRKEGVCGHGHDFWPGRRHWSCCASILENSECSVANASDAVRMEE